MRTKYKSLLKNIGLFTIGSFGSKIISFILLPLYTAILTTSDYGTVDLLQSTAQLLIPILLLSIQDATLRFSMDKNYKKEDVLSTTMRIVSIGSLILLISLVILGILNPFNLSFFYYLFLFASFVLGACNTCFNLYLKAKNDAKNIAISGIVGTLVTCALNVLFLVYIKLGVIGYIVSLILGLLFQCLYQFIAGKIHKDIHFHKYNNLSKEMISYSSPLVANSVAWWVNNASDRYILTWILGAANNGIYAIAYKIPTILTTFQGIVYNAWSISAIAEYDKKDSDGFIGKNYTFYSLFSLLICSVIIALNIPIAKLLYSNDFYSAWACVPFLLVSTVFNGIAQWEGSLFAAEKKTKLVASTTIVGAIINIVLNFTLISTIGIVGAAFSTFIGYFVTWILRTKFLKKFVTMQVNWKIHYLSVLVLIAESTLATLNMCYPAQLLCILLIVFLNKGYLGKIIFMVVSKGLKDKK